MGGRCLSLLYFYRNREELAKKANSLRPRSLISYLADSAKFASRCLLARSRLALLVRSLVLIILASQPVATLNQCHLDRAYQQRLVPVTHAVCLLNHQQLNTPEPSRDHLVDVMHANHTHSNHN